MADMVVSVGPGLTLESFSCNRANFLSLHDADLDGHDELLLRVPGSRFVVARIRDRGLELVGGLRDPHFPDGRPGASVEWEETAPPQALMRRGVPYRYVTHGKSEFPGGDYLARLAWTRPGGVLRVEGVLYADLEVLTFPDARPIRVPPGARLPEFVETLARRGLFTLQKRND
jgi:hypothetical protein